MQRRSLIGIFVVALMWTMSVSAAQIKEMPRTAPKPLNAKAAIVDINSAPETDIAALGIDKAVARKIVDARPFRNKRELVSRKLLTMDQYNKLKDQLVAKQPPKKASRGGQ